MDGRLVDPLEVFLKMIPSRANRHCADHQQRKQEFGQRNDQGNNSDEFVIVSAQQQQRQRPHGREEDQHGKQVSAVQHQCTIPTTAFPPNGQKKMTAITTSAPTTTHTA